jgi:hypothetical protein
MKCFLKPGFVFLFILLLNLSSSAQNDATRVRRLILKDGSYQLVTKYEVQGDRVHYFSSERDEWEDLPNALVDWPATEQYEQDQKAAASTPAVVELDKSLDKESDAAEAKLPVVAPGLHLPDYSGVFLLDSFQGEPQLLEVKQSAGDVNQNSKVNILRAAIPGAGVKQNIELEGAHASVQSHVGVPSIYMNVDEAAPDSGQPGLILDSTRPAKPQQPEQPQQPQQPQQPSVPFDRYRIVRMDVKGNKRIVGDVKRQPTGKISQDEHTIKTTISSIAGGWLKLTPVEPLAPGEYAIVEVVEKQINLYVWDFGVNPKAPANANPYKPEKPDAKP